MTPRPPRLALRLLQRYAPDNEPLVGDILETFAERPSRLWLWSQVGAAMWTALFTRSAEIRPLHLVEHQPLDAVERTLEMHRRRPGVSPTPSPLPASLGLIILAGLITALAPVVWWGLLVTFAGGVLLAWLLVIVHKRHPRTHALRRLT